jgi:predicted RNA-binding Zn-ribbon protein involved in translation (DUF1610 family)
MVTLIFYVPVFLLCILFVGMIWLLATSPSPFCPKCGCRDRLETRATRIPGSEYAGPSSERAGAFFYAKYHVHYRCQDCGHTWSAEETRSV